MSKQELLAAVSALPDDAEIFIMQGDDILGDYAYVSPLLLEETAYISPKGGLDAGISNYRYEGAETKRVWVLS